MGLIKKSGAEYETDGANKGLPIFWGTLQRQCELPAVLWHGGELLNNLIKEGYFLRSDNLLFARLQCFGRALGQ